MLFKEMFSLSAALLLVGISNYHGAEAMYTLRGFRHDNPVLIRIGTKDQYGPNYTYRTEEVTMTPFPLERRFAVGESFTNAQHGEVVVEQFTRVDDAHCVVLGEGQSMADLESALRLTDAPRSVTGIARVFCVSVDLSVDR